MKTSYYVQKAMGYKGYLGHMNNGVERHWVGKVYDDLTIVLYEKGLRPNFYNELLQDPCLDSFIP